MNTDRYSQVKLYANRHRYTYGQFNKDHHRYNYSLLYTNHLRYTLIQTFLQATGRHQDDFGTDTTPLIMKISLELDFHRSFSSTTRLIPGIASVILNCSRSIHLDA